MLRQSPTLQGHREMLLATRPRGSTAGPEEFHGRPKRKSKHLSVNRGPEFPTPPPSPQLRPHAHAKPAASARAVTSSRGCPAPGRAAHRVGGGSRASLDAASRNRGSLSARAPGEGRWRQRACVRLPSGAGALLASLARRDPVLRVGAGGAPWAIPAVAEKREKEMGREPNSWEGRVCFWDGAGLDGRILLCVCVGHFPRS